MCADNEITIVLSGDRLNRYLELKSLYNKAKMRGIIETDKDAYVLSEIEFFDEITGLAELSLLS